MSRAFLKFSEGKFPFCGAVRETKRIRAAAEGPALLQGLPPRTPPTWTKGKTVFSLWKLFPEAASGHRRLRTSDCQLKFDEFEWFIPAFA